MKLLAACEKDLPKYQRLRTASRGAAWELCGNRDEKLLIDFEEAAVRAGIALNAPTNINPVDHWLEHLRLYLICSDSEMLFPQRDRNGIIIGPLVGSAMFCSSIVKFVLAENRATGSEYDGVSLGSAVPAQLQQTRPERLDDAQKSPIHPHKRLVEDFLRSCRAAGIPVKRLYIAAAAGQNYTRRLEYWQKGQRKIGRGPGYTSSDDRNFRRVLAMAPQAFWKAAQAKLREP